VHAENGPHSQAPDIGNFTSLCFSRNLAPARNFSHSGGHSPDEKSIHI